MAKAYSVEAMYRQVHEITASCTWAASAVICGAAGLMTGMPAMAAGALITASTAMSVVRAYEASELVNAKIALAGHAFWLLPVSEFDKILARQKGKLYLGRGFRWTAKHTQRAIELNSLDLKMTMPPNWFLKAIGRPYKFEDTKGDGWIHGLEPTESEISMPWDHAEGNWCIFGTTGAGKTRLYESLTYQMVARGDTLIFFDPKFDVDLRDMLKRVCIKAGRPEAFAEFHPAFPSTSVRLDPLANFTGSTEIASRVTDPISGGGPQDTFTSFVWRVVNSVTEGLLYTDQKPSLKMLRRYVEGGPEPLVEACLEKFFKLKMPGTWENHVATLTDQLTNNPKKPKVDLATGTPRQQAMVQIYIHQVPAELKEEKIAGLLGITIHSREHMGKMVAQLLPLLTQLTAGSLGELLSPDYNDQNDTREILDMQKIIRSKRVVYIATNSLADATVGSAIAAILLSDLRAEAGARYNAMAGNANVDKSRVHIVCDEAAELVTPPLIAIMNKGRGAGMISYLASQNFSDYIAKFGDEHKARMVIGNGNNRLTLRVIDVYTQQYMVESFGEVQVDTVSRGISGGTESENQGMEFRSNRTTSVSKQSVATFPGFLLGRLPDLHFVAQISGGRMYKGRIPKLVS